MEEMRPLSFNEYSTIRSRRRKRRHSLRFFITFFIGTIVVFFLFLYIKEDKKLPVVSSTLPTPVASPSVATVVPSVHAAATGSLEAAVLDALTGTKGTYGVIVKNLKTNETYSLNEHTVFESGSLYKLWIMAVVYDQIKKGNLKESDVLSESIKTLNDKFDIDPELAELTDGQITLTVASALNQMITISHNYAALLLTQKVKLSTVQSFLNAQGFTESKVGVNGQAPTTTTADIELFLERLYTNKLSDKATTDKMITLLKNQQLNDKLPRYLPESIDIAHKTGELDYYSHDAGIVYTTKGDYIIVVLSKSDMPAAAEDRIANISKAVYDYFSK